MRESVVDQMRGVNTRLRGLLSQARNCLAGRGSFGGADVRAMAEPVASVQAILDDAKNLRAIHPDLSAELDIYKENLQDMQLALEQMRVMLATRRAHIQAARGHLATLGMWNATLRLTR